MLWVLAVTGLITAMILWQVDDWSRDFSTNVAMTGESAKIKPLRLSIPPDQALQRVKSSVLQMSHWQWASEKEDAETLVVNLVRSTRLFRFKDDVQLTINPDATSGGSVIHAISRSRVGKGDLGQNPRNINELFARIEASRD